MQIQRKSNLWVLPVILGLLVGVAINPYGAKKSPQELNARSPLISAGLSANIFPVRNATWGTGGVDYSYAAVASGQYLYLTGSSTGGPFGGEDRFLAKVDNMSEVIILKWWGGAGDDQGRGVGVDGAGNVYTIGDTEMIGFAPSQIEFIKYDPTGTLVWNTTWGGTGDEASYHGFVAPDGTCYSAGFNRYGLYYDAIVVKCNAQGDVIWNRTLGGNGNDESNDVVADQDHNVYLTGYVQSWGAGGKDVFLAKYDRNGVLLFNRTWGGPNTDEAYAIALGADGTVVVAGYTASWTVPLNNDALLLGFDENGTLLWNQSWGGTGADFFRDVMVDWDGSLFATGYTNSFGGGVGRNILLANFTSTGSLAWNASWSDVGNEDGYTVSRVGDKVWVTGYISAAGEQEILLLTYDFPLPVVPPPDYTLAWILLGGIAVVVVVMGVFATRKRK